MIIVLKSDSTQEQLDHLLQKIEQLGLKTNVSQGVEKTIVGVIGPEDVLRVTPLEVFPGVDKVIPVLAPYRLVSREYQHSNSIIKIGNSFEIGGTKVSLMAGPCSIEGLDELRSIAQRVKESGSSVLRGGAFKPRTSPYDFQGLGEKGLEILKKVGEEFELATITEVMDPRDVDLVAQYVDVLQIGARNMQNFSLLKEVGKIKKPIMLKRGISATVKEWLMSAEYILAKGNFDVIFCERGIRTFETMTRNTLDINAIGLVKKLSHLPIVVDPSHATGEWSLVGNAAKAAVAAGCDGLIIEVHDNPEKAFSDGAQSLIPEKYFKLVGELQEIAKAVSREI